CWEVYASNSAAVRYYEESASAGRNGKPSRTPERELTFEDILRLVKQGDAKAGEALDRMAHYLGLGISMLITGLAPDVIVVVGEITRVWDRVGPRIDQAIRERSYTHAPTRIVPTDPAAQPRLRGTIAFVLQKHFGAPSVA
ncbi:MAG: ROK family protein, partial [Blastocatellia bacterium]